MGRLFGPLLTSLICLTHSDLWLIMKWLEWAGLMWLLETTESGLVHRRKPLVSSSSMFLTTKHWSSIKSVKANFRRLHRSGFCHLILNVFQKKENSRHQRMTRSSKSPICAKLPVAVSLSCETCLHWIRVHRLSALRFSHFSKRQICY